LKSSLNPPTIGKRVLFVNRNITIMNLLLSGGSLPWEAEEHIIHGG
jgi:hypothetical protein